MTKKTPVETRAKLLQAAIKQLVTDGTSQFTLASVAENAGVSKGGLLHHFPTKEALLRGLVERADQIWQLRFQQELEKEPEGTSGRWARAYIRATFDRDEEELELMLALTRVISAYPDLFIGPHSPYNQGWSQNIDDGLPRARALTIQVACDGLWLSEIVGMPIVPHDLRNLVRTDLLRLTYVDRDDPDQQSEPDPKP
jgi:AcrR family transcriptional regulator